jgi:muramoyltetrapeptide carboxypeptidase
MRSRPAPLAPGATVGIVASSSPVFGEEEVRRGVARLSGAGLVVRFLPRARARLGYLAGEAQERAADLHDAFADPDIDAVLQLRGGYGSAHVLPLLDWDRIRAAPKPLIGMSDATMLHLALTQHARLATYWGPGLTGLGRATDYTWEAFRRAVLDGAVVTVSGAPDGPLPHTITGGVVEGVLVGGTTSLLAASLGTPWQIDAAGAVLLIEDVGEEPYRIDRLLTQLQQAGVLGAAAGVVVGEHAGVKPRGSFPGGSLSLDEILERIIAPLGVPAVSGLPLGHGRHLATVPLGVRARLDADAPTLTVPA